MNVFMPINSSSTTSAFWVAVYCGDMNIQMVHHPCSSRARKYGSTQSLEAFFSSQRYCSPTDFRHSWSKLISRLCRRTTIGRHAAVLLWSKLHMQRRTAHSIWKSVWGTSKLFSGWVRRQICGWWRSKHSVAISKWRWSCCAYFHLVRGKWACTSVKFGTIVCQSHYNIYYCRPAHLSLWCWSTCM